MRMSSVTISLSNLRHFKQQEFGTWWPQMSAELLFKLDDFREEWGHPVLISPAEGTLGRHLGDSLSDHNVDKWGEVRAADVFPLTTTLDGGYSYLFMAEERRRAFRVAKQVGFNAIGLYTDTKPGNMVHLGVRPGLNRVAKWARIKGVHSKKGVYTKIEEVL